LMTAAALSNGPSREQDLETGFPIKDPENQ
jgi:hypothetical protein